MKYMSLDQKGSVLAEYVWIDADSGLRSKTKVSHAHSSRCNSEFERNRLRSVGLISHRSVRVAALGS